MEDEGVATSEPQARGVRTAAWFVQALGVLYLLRAGLFVLLPILDLTDAGPSRDWGLLADGPFAAIYGAGILWLGLNLPKKDNLRETTILLALLTLPPVMLAAFIPFMPQIGMVVVAVTWTVAVLHVVAVLVCVHAYRRWRKQQP